MWCMIDWHDWVDDAFDLTLKLKSSVTEVPKLFSMFVYVGPELGNL